MVSGDVMNSEPVFLKKFGEHQPAYQIWCFMTFGLGVRNGEHFGSPGKMPLVKWPTPCKVGLCLCLQKTLVRPQLLKAMQNYIHIKQRDFSAHQSESLTLDKLIYI